MLQEYIRIFYGLIALILLAGGLFLHPKEKGRAFYFFTLLVFFLGGILVNSMILAVSSLVAGVILWIRLVIFKEKNRSIEVILMPYHDDPYLEHFLHYYQNDIQRIFPRFDFHIEEEYLIAMLVSDMETVGLIVAEIVSVDTLHIKLDYMVPKYRNSQLAHTFYRCELRCIDFLGYSNFVIEPQGVEHNKYLERLGFNFEGGFYIKSLDN